jgi:hypothetical protein
VLKISYFEILDSLRAFKLLFSEYSYSPSGVNRQIHPINQHTMTEKNLILCQRSSEQSVMTPLRKESTNPVARFLLHQLELISKLVNKWATP